MHGYGMYLYFSVGADKVPKVCQGVFRLNLSLEFFANVILLPALLGLLDERQVCIWCRGAGGGQLQE